MCRVSRLSMIYFLSSTFFLITLSLVWFGMSWNLCKFDVPFFKDPIKKENYSTRDEYGRFLHRDVENQNANSDASGNYFMDFTKTAFNWDTTTNPAILENERTFPLSTARKMKPKRTHTGSLKQTLSIRSSISSKQSLDVFTRVARNSVYGEMGCPDNPWREDLHYLLQNWVRISKQNNIEYVLAYGSLLGAMRDGDVIPYDSDIDILMDVTYFSIIKSLSVARNFNSSDGKIRLVVQPEFTLNIPVEKRKRFGCLGEVLICFFVLLFIIFLTLDEDSNLIY